MTAAIRVKTDDGFDVVIAKRKARKEWRCQSDIDAGKPGGLACRKPDSHIHPGDSYLEVYEGEDEFHPLRYHAACAVETWGIAIEKERNQR